MKTAVRVWRAIAYGLEERVIRLNQKPEGLSLAMWRRFTQNPDYWTEFYYPYSQNVNFY